jgi:hypothetical protein
MSNFDPKVEDSTRRNLSEQIAHIISLQAKVFVFSGNVDYILIEGFLVRVER